jgi:sterol desaturase/sphingolipid hydroxylase (fatty acid hydroxylase superfamily)
MIYTFIHRLGLFRVALFFLLGPLLNDAFGQLRVAGLGTFHLDQLWPGVTDGALVSLLIYLVVFDFFAYWLHRGQHGIGLWWRLHSLHHAQRQMSMWSDNRNHFLDDLLLDVLLVLLAQLIGVAPEQFIAIVALTQLSESLQHANVRLSFGRVGERLWVSPRFHRLHHSIHCSEQNYGVLLPWWDQIFGTANFQHKLEPTGVPDQIEQQRDYGRGLWSQQWQGLKRLLGRA